MIDLRGSRHPTRAPIPADHAVPAAPTRRSQPGTVVALIAGGAQVSADGRLLQVLGVPSLAVGTPVLLDRPPGESADLALLRIPGAPPVAVRIAADTGPATLAARSHVPITATLVTASGRVAAVDVVVAPPPPPDAAQTPKPVLADFLRGEPVTGITDGKAALALDGAVLRLPLQPCGLPASMPLTIRLLSPAPPAAGSSEASDLPRLPHDATLAARLEPLVGSALPMATAAPVPLALLGLPGAAAVISRTIDPDQHSDHGSATDGKVLALEVEYPKLGRVRVVVRTLGGRFDVILRSERTLTPAVRREIGQLVEAAGKAGGLGTSTGFARLSGGGG